MAKSKPSEKLLTRIREYASEEPSFTASFAAWDLSTNHGYKISGSGVKNAMEVLERRGELKLIEDGGRMGRVYVYTEPRPVRHIAPIETRTYFPELDESRLAGIGSEAPARGVVVPHTRAQGSTGKPGKDRKLQERGVRVKRARQGT